MKYSEFEWTTLILTSHPMVLVLGFIAISLTEVIFNKTLSKYVQLKFH